MSCHSEPLLVFLRVQTTSFAFFSSQPDEALSLAHNDLGLLPCKMTCNEDVILVDKVVDLIDLLLLDGLVDGSSHQIL